MPTARDLLAEKNSAVVYTCSPDATLADACRMLRDRRVGCLVVVADEVQGLLSERDVVVRAVAQGLDPATARVRDAMRRPVPTVALETSCDDVEALLRAAHAHHAVVAGARGLLGVVSLGDLARFYAHRERPAQAEPVASVH